MLVDCMMADCVLMEKKRTPDGSGGYITEWTEGDRIRAAITRSNSMEARIADAAGTVEVYNVAVSRSVHLAYHAVIKRVSDGKTFRITSDNAENRSPVCATLDLAISTAEAWRLTT